MSTTATRRRRRREAARQRAEEARTSWRDREFGISLVETRYKAEQVRVIWKVDAMPQVALMSLPRVRAVLDELEAQQVLQLRQDGESWEEVGFWLGITGEGARRRFSHLDAGLSDA